MRSFRELDEQSGRAKGSAFRAFKRLEPTLRVGRDFRLLRADTDAAEIDTLRLHKRIYPNSINIVLLDDGVAERLLKHLRGTPDAGQ